MRPKEIIEKVNELTSAADLKQVKAAVDAKLDEAVHEGRAGPMTKKKAGYRPIEDVQTPKEE